MGTSWRRAFCKAATTDDGVATPSIIVMEKEQSPSPKIGKTNNVDNNNHGNNNIITGDKSVTPKLQCKTTTKSHAGSNTSSPRSPFAILKRTLTLSKSSCGVCMQSVKRGQGTAIYRAECSRVFHFSCIASHVRNQNNLICPVCSTTWKDIPLLAIHKENQIQTNQEKEKIVEMDCYTPRKQTRNISSPKCTKQRDIIEIYADDEPLVTTRAGTKFVPIQESKFENVEEIEEFHRFFVNPISSSDDDASVLDKNSRNIEISIFPDAAVISMSPTYGTYAVVFSGGRRNLDLGGEVK